MPIAHRDLASVVAIAMQSPTAEPGATGFLYGYPEPEHRLWLITCKHVPTLAIAEGESQLFVRMNQSQGAGKTTFSIPLLVGGVPTWTLHPSADVAVIPTSWPDLEAQNIQWECFASGINTFTIGEMGKVGIWEGEEVHVLGFPVGWQQANQDYPIVRHGLIAQIQGCYDGDHDTYLVDGSVFPGNSGGPVLTSRQYGNGSRLIGMVSAFMLAEIREQPPLTQNADLAVIVPLDAIDETVDMALERPSTDGE